MRNSRIYPKEFLQVPEIFEPAQMPPTKNELEEAIEIRSKFLFPKDNLPYMVDFVRAFRLIRDAQNYIEIGTYDKGNLAFISRQLAPDAHIIDVDIAEHLNKTKLLAETIAKTQHLTTIIGDSTDPKTVDAVKLALQGVLADAIFIDGNHVADMVMCDYAHFAPLVRPGGIPLFP